MSYRTPKDGSSENAHWDGNRNSVALVYDEDNDATKMARSDANGNQLVSIIDPVTGKQVQVESNGGLAVNIQDQHSRAFDLYFAQDVGSSTTLIADTVAEAYTMSCTTGHGLVATNFFVMFDPISQHGFTAEVVSIAGDNTVNLDRPLPFAFPSATTVIQERKIDMNVDGSGTRQTFEIGSLLTAELDITRLMFQMTTTDPATFASFGDQSALSRGMIFRKLDGFPTTYWNVKTNGDLAILMYDLHIFDSTHPLAVNGVAGRLTYASQGKHGVTLRIGGGESLELIIQDNISDLLSFRVMAQGHIVTD